MIPINGELFLKGLLMKITKKEYDFLSISICKNLDDKDQMKSRLESYKYKSITTDINILWSLYIETKILFDGYCKLKKENLDQEILQEIDFVVNMIKRKIDMLEYERSIAPQIYTGI